MNLDPEIFKAILGCSIFTVLGAIYGANVKRGTDKDAHKLAVARLILEREKEAYEERHKERAYDASRIKELRGEIKEGQMREAELEVRYYNLDKIYTERVTACRECGYPCVQFLKKSPPGPVGQEGST